MGDDDLPPPGVNISGDPDAAAEDETAEDAQASFSEQPTEGDYTPGVDVEKVSLPCLSHC